MLSLDNEQTSGAEKILYGYDSAAHSHTVIIVEGEIDKLSLDQAGVAGAISVPDGAPAKVRPETEAAEAYNPEQDVKFSYVWQVGKQALVILHFELRACSHPSKTFHILSFLSLCLSAPFDSAASCLRTRARSSSQPTTTPRVTPWPRSWQGGWARSGAGESGGHRDGTV